MACSEEGFIRKRKAYEKHRIFRMQWSRRMRISRAGAIKDFVYKKSRSSG